MKPVLTEPVTSTQANEQAQEEWTTRRNPEMERYVELRPVVVEGEPDAHNVYLSVENQRFLIGPYASETRADAEWMRDMLCIALAKIVASALPSRTGGDLDCRSADSQSSDDRGKEDERG